MSNAIEELFHNKELLKEYKQKALMRSKDFEIKNVLKQWEVLLDTLDERKE